MAENRKRGEWEKKKRGRPGGGGKRNFRHIAGKREEKREKVFESRFFCGTYIV